jgi:hypothetical protein
LIDLDASVVFPLYRSDQNSAFAAPLISSAQLPLLVSSFCEFEVVNAFSLCVFRKDISAQQALGARRKLELNIGTGAFITLPLPANAFLRAKILSERITRLSECEQRTYCISRRHWSQARHTSTSSIYGSIRLRKWLGLR